MSNGLVHLQNSRTDIMDQGPPERISYCILGYIPVQNILFAILIDRVLSTAEIYKLVEIIIKVFQLYNRINSSNIKIKVIAAMA